MSAAAVPLRCSPRAGSAAVTTVAGNVSVENRNALQLLHFWDADIATCTGAATTAASVTRCGIPSTASPAWKAMILSPSAPTVGEACVYRYPGCADERPEP